MGFLKMVESKIFRIGKNPGNPLRLIGRQLYSRKVKKRAGKSDLHKALLMKGSEILMGVPGSQ